MKFFNYAAIASICLFPLVSDAQQTFLMKIDSLSILRKYGKISDKQYKEYCNAYTHSIVEEDVQMKKSWDSLSTLNKSGKISDAELRKVFEYYLNTDMQNSLEVENRRKIITKRLEAKKSKKKN